MTTRKNLSDILHAGDRDRLSQAWKSTNAATDFTPLPTGEYDCRLISGELFNAKANNTAGYKLTFAVVAGEHADRRVWLDLWLTQAALPMTKRDLKKLGVTSPEQLERALPQGIRCLVKVTLRTSDSGAPFNQVRSFTVVDIDSPEANPFAPQPATVASGQHPITVPPTAIAAGDPPDDGAEPTYEANTSREPTTSEEGRA